MDTKRQPERGDMYAICDDADRWARVLRFVAFTDEARGVADFVDDDGTRYTIPLAQLTPLRTVDPHSRPDPAEQLDDRLYRGRSRVTAQQRANRKLTAKQRTMLFALARNRGMDIDDIRAMTPQGSISKLTIREAGVLIDRLQGRAVGT